MIIIEAFFRLGKFCFPPLLKATKTFRIFFASWVKYWISYSKSRRCLPVSTAHQWENIKIYFWWVFRWDFEKERKKNNSTFVISKYSKLKISVFAQKKKHMFGGNLKPLESTPKNLFFSHMLIDLDASSNDHTRQAEKKRKGIFL